MGGQNDDNDANDDDTRIRTAKKHEIHLTFARFFPWVSEEIIPCQWIVHEKVQNYFLD